MQLGLYTCAGNYTCKWNRPGSLDHWVTDANTMAQWGVSYVKMDWCFHGPLPPSVYYGNMSAALNATGSPIWFATCDWGEGQPWTGEPPHCVLALCAAIVPKTTTRAAISFATVVACTPPSCPAKK